MKKLNFVLSLLVIIGCLTLLIRQPSASVPAAFQTKNIIVMIPDGTGIASLTAARHQKGAPLALDAAIYGIVETRSADNSITDSAAAATALACGVRTRNGTVGVDPDGVPVVNLMEWSLLRGKATGVVTTDKIVGATPSGFSAHALHRNDAEALIEQQIYSGIDLYLGGGTSLLTPDRKARMEAEGYTVVQTAEALATAEGKVFGLFAPGEMTPMVLRKGKATSTEPTLVEMSMKAIELLSKDEDGFVLMIEGALIDKGNHASDLPWATEDLLAFDEAVAAVLAWAEERNDTVVVILPDHETGGLTLLNEPSEGARGTALRAATQKGLPPSQFNVHYSSTWHTATDVFLAGNRREVRFTRNDALVGCVAGMEVRRLEPLEGTMGADEKGWPTLTLAEGKVLRAYEDALYFPRTKKWYRKAQ